MAKTRVDVGDTGRLLWDFGSGCARGWTSVFRGQATVHGFVPH